MCIPQFPAVSPLLSLYIAFFGHHNSCTSSNQSFYLQMADDVEMDKAADKSATMSESSKTEKMFSLKRWNAVAMWSWDVECEICAICRVQVMGKSQINLSSIETFLAPSLNSKSGRYVTCAWIGNF